MKLQDFIDNLIQFETSLVEAEKSKSTIIKYKCDLQKFIDFATKNKITEITKKNILEYKEYITSIYKTSTVNTCIVVLNKYLEWLNSEDLKIKAVKCQTKNALENVLGKSDYERLLKFAKKLNKEKMYYIMRVLAGTGIRIEELKYITTQSIKKGQTEVNNKGKIRTIIISAELCKELKKYCKDNNIDDGIIFHARDKSKLIDKAYIWRELKYIAGQARVSKIRVHAHSFRHLFAKTYMEVENNVVELADLLGHSSLETTRIYTRTSTQEKKSKISRLGL